MSSSIPFAARGIRFGRLPRLVRTASFKFASFYAVVFGVSVLILGFVIYFIAATAIDDQMRARIEAEASALQDVYAASGEVGLRRAVELRQSKRQFLGLEYALFGSKGMREFGTVPQVAVSNGWTQFIGPADGDEEAGEQERLEVLVTPLLGGQVLAVADDLNRRDELGEVILRAFGIAFALSVTLAIGGGMLLSALFLSRVDAITKTAEAIIEGNINERVTIKGTGDDLDHLSATLNRMLDRIAALMEAMRQVTNDVAHDLRTPIGRLRQTLDEALRTSATVQELQSAIETAITESDSILETFAALLRIAQIETGHRKAGFRRVNLSELVDGIAQTFAPAAEDEGRPLRASVASNLFVIGDRELLTQMIVNLVHNAISHTQPSAEITLTLEQQGAGLLLAVFDNGPGIPSDERERVLRRFYRLDHGRARSGNGLGLSLVQAIAELHGIEVTLADNKPGLRVEMRFAKQE